MKTENWNPTDYAKHSTEQFKWANEVIESMHLKGNESLLDIGCGDGKITVLLSKKLSVGQVVGIDSSQPMIDEATRRFGKQENANVTFQRADAANLSFSNHFDIVFSNAALHWIKDHIPVLKGIYGALKPGGRCYLSFGGYGNGQKLFEAIHRVVDTPHWKPYFKKFEEIWAFHHSDDYKQWVIDAGLEPVNVSLVPKTAVYPNKDGLIGYLRTAWHQYNRYLPEDKVNGFASDVVDAYLEKYPPDSNGNIVVTMVRLEVEATKPTSKVSL